MTLFIRNRADFRLHLANWRVFIQQISLPSEADLGRHLAIRETGMDVHEAELASCARDGGRFRVAAHFLSFVLAVIITIKLLLASQMILI